MQALKALVIVMGIAIAAGVVILALTIHSRLQNSLGEVDGAAFGRLDLAAPAGSRIVDARADGDRLVVTVEGADARRWVAVVDLASGTVLGSLHLVAEP